MTQDLDAFVHAALTPGKIAPRRLDALIGATLARLDRRQEVAMGPAFRAACARFALPMAAAAALGLVVGTYVAPNPPAEQVGLLALSSSTAMTGF
ncbi:MAG: hypothetical protein HY985_06800 [Magnetospirillum sp.]|nr:hypothetical protein [Magnetospirillum sp.]